MDPGVFIHFLLSEMDLSTTPSDDQQFLAWEYECDDVVVPEETEEPCVPATAPASALQLATRGKSKLLIENLDRVHLFSNHDCDISHKFLAKTLRRRTIITKQNNPSIDWTILQTELLVIDPLAADKSRIEQYKSAVKMCRRARADLEPETTRMARLARLPPTRVEFENLKARVAELQGLLSAKRKAEEEAEGAPDAKRQATEDKIVVLSFADMEQKDFDTCDFFL